jgi:hypothetical protein
MDGVTSDPEFGHSLSNVRDEHIELLSICDDLPLDARKERTRALRQRIVEAGAWIEDPGERDAAQGLLDYWTSALSTLPGEAFPELLRIKSFVEANGEAARDRAESAVDELQNEAAEAAAERLIMDSLGGVPAIPVTTLEKAVAATLLEAGVLRWAREGGVLLAHASLLSARWPRLKAWKAGRAVEAATLAGFVAAAEMWEQARRRKTDYLLSGDQLRQAQAFAKRDQGLDRLLEASRAARSAGQRRMALEAMGVTVALVAIWFVAKHVGGAAPTKSLQAANNTIAVLKTEKTQSDLTKDALISEQAAADSPAAVTESDRRPALDPKDIRGQIWIGNKDAPLITAAGRAVDVPDGVKAGQIYSPRINLVLRNGFPDASYRSAAALGVLPAGARFRALEAPRGVQRSSATQYWLTVQPLVTAYVQFNGERRQLEPIVSTLRTAGFVLPGQERRTDWSGKLEVRYYRDEDLPAAERLFDILNGMVEGAGRRACVPFAGLLAKPAPPGVVEAWIDLRSFRVSARPRPPAGENEAACGRIAAPVRSAATLP